MIEDSYTEKNERFRAVRLKVVRWNRKRDRIEKRLKVVNMHLCQDSVFTNSNNPSKVTYMGKDEDYKEIIKKYRQKNLFARELIISCANMYINVGSYQIDGDVFTMELEKIATKLNITHSEIKVIIESLHREFSNLQFSLNDENDFISVTI